MPMRHVTTGYDRKCVSTFSLRNTAQGTVGLERVRSAEVRQGEGLLSGRGGGANCRLVCVNRMKSFMKCRTV